VPGSATGLPRVTLAADEDQEENRMPLTETHAYAAQVGEGESMLEENELPVPAVWFGVFAITVFLLLLAVTYSFRTVAHRQ